MGDIDQTTKTERFWRDKIAAELEEFAQELVRVADVPSMGFATAAIVREAGARVRRAPTSGER